jgi:NADH-quinone oxidoreductase subunit C
LIALSKPAAPTPTPPSPRPAPAAPPAAKPAPPPAPAPVRAKEMGDKLTARFPGARVDYMRQKRLKVTVPLKDFRAAATMARDELGFDHMSAVSGVDWISKNELEIVYFVGSVRAGLEDFVIALSERIPRDNPAVETMIDVWPGAEFHERETHEMFGINFQGHPNQNHLLLPEDWNDMPPLRKDYVSPGH